MNSFSHKIIITAQSYNFITDRHTDKKPSFLPTCSSHFYLLCLFRNSWIHATPFHLLSLYPTACVRPLLEMSKEMTEEGQIHKPLLLGGEDCEDDARGGDSSATPMLVFRTLVAVSGSYACGSAVGYLSPAQSGIMQDLDITVAEYSLFGSILTIGAMIGAILSGKLADYIGRRGTMSFSEIFCIIGWLAIAFSKVQVPWWLDLGRLLVGCGMGILSYVVPIYIAEITPKNLRGGFTTVHQLMVCCGVSLTFIVGTLVKWPVLAMIGTVPALVQLLGLFFIPESPRWLAKIGRETECKAALQYLRGSGVDIYEEASEIKIPLTLLGVILTDISGRRPRLMDHQLWRASTPIFALVGVLVYSGSFSLGMGAIPCVIMSEIFPINMKGLGGSLVTLVRWLGSWIVTYSFNFLMEWSSSGVFSIFSSICGFPVLFVVKLIPETKRRTLEDIQSALNTLPAKH